jgi:hypothetical protein
MKNLNKTENVREASPLLFKNFPLYFECGVYKTGT